MMIRSVIRGSGSALPARAVSNAELAANMDKLHDYLGV